MGNITKNQQTFLESKGIDTSNLDFDAASALIGSLKGSVSKQNRPLDNAYSGFKKAVNPRFDSQSAYVSYCKDLLIAMMQNTSDKEKFDVVEASKLTIQIVQGFKANFE